MDIRTRHEQNRAAWSEAAQTYDLELAERIAFLKGGGANFCDSERPYLAQLLPCDRAIHLQCAGGTDTLSLWKLGAKEVVGIDISDKMIDVATRKGEAINANASWIRSDIFDAPATLNGTADLVYTGRGAICWIMDISQWAAVIARLLRPGGFFYLFEGHPITWLFSLDGTGLELDPEPPFGNYFSSEVSVSKGWPSTYVGDVLSKPEELSEKHEIQWTLGAVVTALASAGLVIKKLEEHPETYWNIFPNWTPELIKRIPQTFSLLAQKPI